MSLVFLDWLIIGIFLSITIFIGIKFSKRAGKNIAEFFLSGRSLPWYVAGISMVATTFAADTPLAVTELVNKNGISGNWLWWNMLIGGMLTTFFFATLWRRANILTEVEFIELRYSGKAASFLRAFKAVYLGLFMNVLIIGWVNLAFISILQVFFGIPENEVYYYVFGAMMIIALYSSLAGLWGVAINDMVQFVIAMTGSIVLAIFVLRSEQVGGISGMKEQLDPELLNFFPNIGGENTVAGAGKMFSIGIGTFLAYIGVQWWASWYPGAEPGGGGYIAQRMMSAKNEKHSLFATLFFQVAHYCIRPWPWIIVALGTIILYPELAADDKKLGYVMAMKDHLPAGWKGLMLVAFISAYMSTISTQLNWGSSYLVNDIYKRFLFKGKKKERFVFVSRITTVALAFIAILVTTQLSTIAGVWHFIIECGAGLGLVLILRWYWWRINVWSEISATIAPFIFYAIFKLGYGLEFPNSFFLTVLFTTIVWLAITYLTKAESKDTLLNFYDRVKPDGIWNKILKDRSTTESNIKAEEIGERRSKIGLLLIRWFSAVIMTYSVLFATGKLIFQEWEMFAKFAVIALISFGILLFTMREKARN